MPTYKFQPHKDWKLEIPRSGGAGFTLIEILVAISIVSIVFGVILTSAAAIAKSSRDTQRKADLKNIQSALQQYYADQNFFPDDDGNNGFILLNDTNLTDKDGNPNIPSATRNYLSLLPKDPTVGTSTPYCYKSYTSSDLSTACDNTTGSSTQCHYYRLFAKLENQPNGSGNSCGVPSTYNWIVTAN